MHGASWGWTFCSVFACMCATHITCGNTSSGLRPCSTVDTSVTITTTAHFLVCRCFSISQQKDLFHISTNRVVKHLLYLYNRTCTPIQCFNIFYMCLTPLHTYVCSTQTHAHTSLHEFSRPCRVYMCVYMYANSSMINTL